MGAPELPSENRDEMNPAQPVQIPELTYWPVTMASGLFALFLGLVTSWIVALVGILVVVAASAGWFSDINQA
jgi:hypothetical protein